MGDKENSQEEIPDENLSNDIHAESAPSISSDKRAGDSTTSASRRGSRKLSRISETVTVISNCEKDPNTCVLCGGGIPASKCFNCENEAHNRCIEAFFCTLGRKVDLRCWKCPKCVTMTHMNKEPPKREVSKCSQVESVPDPDCPFCRIDMDLKNCRCQDCYESLRKNPAILKRCYCDEGGKLPPILRYNKCLQYRDFGTRFDYKSLNEEREEEKDGKDDKEEHEKYYRWSVLVHLLVSATSFLCVSNCYR
ncbi:hypothetical protein HHI36_013877 [Cryptolaemus montrouzieri]|uniref:Uncharacterized protein n=1 Tax=Cryptolaemus montrouzieri TaxID=559131 RepID=A0ABD2N188_9CUCU